MTGRDQAGEIGVGHPDWQTDPEDTMRGQRGLGDLCLGLIEPFQQRAHSGKAARSGLGQADIAAVAVQKPRPHPGPDLLDMPAVQAGDMPSRSATAAKLRCSATAANTRKLRSISVIIRSQER